MIEDLINRYAEHAAKCKHIFTNFSDSMAWELLGKQYVQDLNLIFMPELGSQEYENMWLGLIGKSKYAINFITEPSEEMILMHKMLWEI